MRGQYKSDGTWYPFRDEATDGYDTIEWAAALPKSNGKVGMYGFSYPGATQWLPATLRPPHLTAIVPAMTSSDYRDGWTYEGGALYQAFTQYWPLNSIANSAVRRLPEGAALDAGFKRGAEGLRRQVEVVPAAQGLPAAAPGGSARRGRTTSTGCEHPDDDAYWQRWSIRTSMVQEVTVPALNFDGWYDLFLNGGDRELRRHAQERRIAGRARRPAARLGPWVHLRLAAEGRRDRLRPRGGEPDAPSCMQRWYDYWLKGIQNGVDKEPRVRVFVMGANKWRTSNEWPIEGTEYRASTTCTARAAANTRIG